MTTLRLFDWGPSPFCLKVRAILDYKRLPYERTSVFGPAMLELWRRGRIGKVPALDIDGELICDSTDIAHAIEARVPEPSILPRDSHERGLCHALEDWSDESLYWFGIYCQWIDPEGRRAAARAFGSGPIGRATHLAYAGRIERQLRGQGTGRKTDVHVRRDLDRTLDAIESMLGDRDHLLGAGPYLCDFALLGQLVYLSHTPIGGQLIAPRQSITRYLERMKSHRR